ncbi:hypothetical protein B0H19DRAFT_73523 [Mycena capillaripes]|nr:hypothetical protein B0H19DRAFT_73523 [Mycena capillaripes]
MQYTVGIVTGAPSIFISGGESDTDGVDGLTYVSESIRAVWASREQVVSSFPLHTD